jgi:hypothetical protein
MLSLFNKFMYHKKKRLNQFSFRRTFVYFVFLPWFHGGKESLGKLIRMNYFYFLAPAYLQGISSTSTYCRTMNVLNI